ncbi:hypothetical protein L0P88_08835 [Muricauda sp. SCSIO 64092]|uniref:hypothetical protein n=1 Tax=Allomuricauda sp. SCSIO 64092 TaxID=2908842 RepID=UPI001FF5FC71|nr:hypothetical protein [Muricauda sp. SCSIO 64092]UOY08644.1 hypothetical protein L0P88_08835 [Muricauda sp. SCSIO 64092]
MENYMYNSIGQLIENKAEKITYFYNASGLVTEVRQNSQPLVKFFYTLEQKRPCGPLERQARRCVGETIGSRRKAITAAPYKALPIMCGI